MEQEKVLYDLKSFEDANIETLYKVEPPLMAVEGGYGYQGVMLRNKIEDKIQCHICGKWFKSVGTHVQRSKDEKHNINAHTYKIKFGLSIRSPLCSNSTSQILSEQSRQIITPNHLKKMHEKAKQKNVFLVKGMTSPMSKKMRKYCFNSAAHKNKFGICEEQMKRRYLIVGDIVGKKEPSSNDLEKYDNKLFQAIYRHYGRLNNFRIKFGFEYRSKASPRGSEWTEDALIAILRKFYFKHKKIPRPAKHFRKGKPHYSSFYRKFGSWNKALSKAGII